MEMTSSVLALIDTQRLPGRAALRALRGPMGLLRREGSRDPRRTPHGHASGEPRSGVRARGVCMRLSCMFLLFFSLYVVM